MIRRVGCFLVLGIFYCTKTVMVSLFFVSVLLAPDGGTYQPAFFDKTADSMSGVSIHGFCGLYAGFLGVFMLVLDENEDRGWRATLSTTSVIVSVS